VSTSLRLVDGTRARLVDFPPGTVGTEKYDGEAEVCLNRSSAHLYTETATWKADGAGELTVTFGKSSVVVFSDTDGYIGRTPDWDAAQISECGADADGAERILQWDCGFAGTTDAGGLTARCLN
jgi:hypothetical protein